ncbi:hypothetical protein D3C80_1135350 [compost metagenome]
MVNIAARPLFGASTIQPVAPSKFITQVADALMPILCSMEPQDSALFSPSEPSALTSTFGTRNSEMPFGPAGASGRRASTRWMMFSVRSWSPPVMKILLPLTL